MLLRATIKSQHILPSCWNTAQRMIPLSPASPSGYRRQYTSSAHISQRSNSAKKILIPRSAKLDQFFNQPRHCSAQKRLTSPFQQRYFNIQKQKDPNCEKRRQRVQFLKYDLNKDYFNEDYGQQPKLLSKRQQEMFGRKMVDTQRQSPRQIRYKSPVILHQDKGSAGNKLGVRSERESYGRKMRSPKTMVHPIEKVMSRGKKIMAKIGSAKSLEYTFGFNGGH